MSTSRIEQKRGQARLRREVLGARISVWRKELGWKQADLARASRVAVRTISNIENGKVTPHITTLRRIEAALRLMPGTTNAILDGLDTPAGATSGKPLAELSRTELDFAAALYGEVDGEIAAEGWLRRALAKRAGY